MSYNRFEKVSIDNPMPCKEVEGTYTRFEEISESNPFPIMVVEADAYTPFEEVSEANPQPIALDTGDTYTRFEYLSDANRKPVVIVEGQSYDTKQPVSMTNPYPVIDTTVASYTGPLDLVPGAVVAFDQFAPSAAWLAGTNNYALLRKSSGGTMQFQYGADGVAPVASIVAWAAGADVFGQTWNDGSGNADDVTNATEVAQPKWEASLTNSKPGFTFDGGFQFLLTAGNISLPNGVCTMLAVARTTDPAFSSAQSLLGMNSNVGLSWLDLFLDGENGKVRATLNDADIDDVDVITNGSVASTVDDYFLITVQLNEANPIIKINGATIASTNNGSGSVDAFAQRLAIGNSDTTETTQWLGQILAEYLYPTSLSDANVLSLSQMLASRYGITLS